MPNKMERMDYDEAREEAGKLTDSLKREYPKQGGDFKPEQYIIFDILGDNLDGYKEIEGDNCDISINPSLATDLPAKFITDSIGYLHENGKILKQSDKEGKYPDEEIISFSLPEIEAIAKKIENKKVKVAKQELAISLAAEKAGLEGAKPIGYIKSQNGESGDYLLMKKSDGLPLTRFAEELETRLDRETAAMIKEIINKRIEEIAQSYRRELKIDKTWHIKDFMIDYDWDNNAVKSITPLDWERVKIFDEAKPTEIEKL